MTLPVRDSPVEFVYAWYPAPAGATVSQSWVLTSDKDGRLRTYYPGRDGRTRVITHRAAGDTGRPTE